MGSRHELPLYSAHQRTQSREERPTNATVTPWPWALGLDLISFFQSLQNLQNLAVLLGLTMEPQIVQESTLGRAGGGGVIGHCYLASESSRAQTTDGKVLWLSGSYFLSSF